MRSHKPTIYDAYDTAVANWEQANRHKEALSHKLGLMNTALQELFGITDIDLLEAHRKLEASGNVDKVLKVAKEFKKHG